MQRSSTGFIINPWQKRKRHVVYIGENKRKIEVSEKK